MEIYNIVTEYVNKEKFTTSDLKELECDFNTFASNGGVSELLLRFQGIQVAAYQDERIQKITLNSNEVFKQATIVCNVNSIISDLIECFAFGKDKTSFAIATDVITKNIKLINKGSFEPEPVYGFLPVTVVQEYEEAIKATGNHFLWNNVPELRLQLLMAAHINVSYDYYVNKDGAFSKFVKSSKVMGNLFSYYNILVISLMSLFFMLSAFFKARFLTIDISFFNSVVVYEHDRLFRKHFLVYFWAVTITSTIIYLALLNRFFHG